MESSLHTDHSSCAGDEETKLIHPFDIETVGEETSSNLVPIKTGSHIIHLGSL